MARRLLASAAALALLSVALPSGASAASRLVAPAAVCPDQMTLLAAPKAQEETMLCMTNYARQQYGVVPLETDSELEGSARSKSLDVLRCDEFSHYACGREFTYWMRSSGYLASKCWRAGENLAWGIGSYGSVGSIFRAWLRSTAHRENILGRFDQIGIDLMIGRLDGRPGTRIWTQHFGSHCDGASG